MIQIQINKLYVIFKFFYIFSSSVYEHRNTFIGWDIYICIYIYNIYSNWYYVTILHKWRLYMKSHQQLSYDYLLWGPFGGLNVPSHPSKFKPAIAAHTSTHRNKWQTEKERQKGKKTKQIDAQTDSMGRLMLSENTIHCSKTNEVVVAHFKDVVAHF